MQKIDKESPIKASNLRHRVHHQAVAAVKAAATVIELTECEPFSITKNYILFIKVYYFLFLN
jgi:hypothetical protein